MTSYCTKQWRSDKTFAARGKRRTKLIKVQHAHDRTPSASRCMQSVTSRRFLKSCSRNLNGMLDMCRRLGPALEDADSSVGHGNDDDDDDDVDDEV